MFFAVILSTLENEDKLMNEGKPKNGENLKQARADLGQAQLQLELGFTLIKVCCIILMITNYHYINKSVNLVTSTCLHTSLLNC